VSGRARTTASTDVDLASRPVVLHLGHVPDAELQKVAANGTLHTPAVLEKQVRRMLADPRAKRCRRGSRRSGCGCRTSRRFTPTRCSSRRSTTSCAESYKRETELLFDSIVREDRNILDLFTADYTFINERIAKVYASRTSSASNFRACRSPREPARHSRPRQHLMLTSVADRTSPVQRGKWIMETLLGSPPPPAPQDPAPPPLEETKAVGAGGKSLTVRERMEEHRKNPACASCHKTIDPLGLALENFDVVGAWRIKDSGARLTRRRRCMTARRSPGRQACARRSSIIRKR
jgi:hypothetical protein